MIEIENPLKAKGGLKYDLRVMKDNLDTIHSYEKRSWESMDAVQLYEKEIS